jgi:hexosaminidase
LLNYYYISSIKINKNLAGWDEIVESDVSNEKALVFWWRHDKPEQLEKALAKGFNTVLCPRIPFYFDFVQNERDTVGRRWGGNFGTIKDAYNYPDSTHEFSAQERELIKGLQANLWTETVESEERLDYMIFPRIIALSESAWTKKNNKDISRFNKNLTSVFEFLDEQNIFYFNSLNPSLRAEPAK